MATRLAGSRRRSCSICSTAPSEYAPHVSSSPDAEVVIVGAGVMGLATARVLAQAGRDVVVCEQFDVGHTRGSSHGGSRIVRLSYPDERWVPLLWFALWAGWQLLLLEAWIKRPGTDAAPSR